MRGLALTVAVVGLLLVAFGIFGIYTTVTDWDILGRSGSMLGLQPDHWRGHWLGTAVMYGALGLTFLCFPIGLWRHSRGTAIAWCITVSALSAVWFALFLLQPFPYGFQQIPFHEVAFLIALSVVSWVLSRRRLHAKAI